MTTSRQMISGLLTILMLGLFIFVSTAGYRIFDLRETTDRLAEHQQKALNDYKELSIFFQETFLKSLDETVKSFPEDNFESYLTEHLKSMSLQGVNSITMAVKKGEELIFVAYNNPKYEEYLQLIDDFTPLYNKQTRVFNGDKEEQFGTGNRIFVTGEMYGDYNVLLGFEEQIMASTMISTLESEVLNDLKIGLNRIIFQLGMLVLGVMATGFPILWFLKKAQSNLKTDCPYYGNDLCAKHKEGLYVR